MEIRSWVDSVPEVSGNKISGTAIVYDSETTIMDSRGKTFTEVVRRGSLNFPSDTLCTFNHDPNELLGRTSSGTLRLKEDARGLHFECDLPEYAKPKIQEMIRRGDLKGCSWTFETVKDNWSTRNAKPFRELTAINVFELGPVVSPAYSTTDVQLRSGLSIWNAKLKLIDLDINNTPRFRSCT